MKIQACSILVSVVCLAFFCQGCVEAPKGTVEGTVTYQGKPLDMGSVVFLSNDRMNTSGGSLGAAGFYRLPNALPVGTYHVGLVPPKRESNPEGPDGPPIDFPIPNQFHRPVKSGLTFNILKGANTANFDIE